MPETLLEPDMLRRLEQLTLVSRKMSTARLKGERRGRRRGSSTDFADYRNYVHGDDLRFLDWKIYARLQRLFIKLFLEEENLHVHILLDTSASMDFGEPGKLLFAKRVAAALGYICLARMDTLTIRTFGESLQESYGPKRGKVHAPGYFQFLNDVEPGERTALEPALRSFAYGTRGKGLVVILSDFYDYQGYEDALRLLFGRDFEVYVIQVLSPEELRPDLQGDLRLVDCEFGETTDVSMGKSIQDLYQRSLNAFCNGLKDFVVSRGGYHVMSSSDFAFEKLVLDVLCRRGLVQ